MNSFVDYCMIFWEQLRPCWKNHFCGMTRVLHEFRRRQILDLLGPSQTLPPKSLFSVRGDPVSWDQLVPCPNFMFFEVELILPSGSSSDPCLNFFEVRADPASWDKLRPCAMIFLRCELILPSEINSDPCLVIF